MPELKIYPAPEVSASKDSLLGEKPHPLQKNVHPDESETELRFFSIRNCVTLHPEQTKWKGGLAPHKLYAVMAYVETCLGDNLRYSELARIAGLSEHHFGSMFRGSTGITPHCYLTKRRIAQARIRLADPAKHERLTDLSLDLGFSSPSHFASVFLRQVGMTPRSYLKTSRKKT